MILSEDLELNPPLKKGSRYVSETHIAVPPTTAVLKPTYSMCNSILTPERNIHFRTLKHFEPMLHVVCRFKKFTSTQIDKGALRVRSVDGKQISTREIRADT